MPKESACSIEEKRLAFVIKVPDGQEINVWVWEERDRKRAENYAKIIAGHLDQLGSGVFV